MGSAGTAELPNLNFKGASAQPGAVAELRQQPPTSKTPGNTPREEVTMREGEGWNLVFRWQWRNRNKDKGCSFHSY